MSLLSELLFPAYRRKVLGLLLLHPEKHYHVREIARITHTVAGSLHRELSKLANAEVLIREGSGNQVYYQANRLCPIFDELVSILRKTSGIVDVLVEALEPISDKIKVALVYGSVARGKETAGSDVDVLILGDIEYDDVINALYKPQEIIGREINPKIYGMEEWKNLLDNNNSFAKEIVRKQKLFIKGDSNDLKKPSRKKH